MNRKLRKTIKTLAGFYGLASGDPFIKNIIAGKDIKSFEAVAGIDELMLEITQGGETFLGIDSIQKHIEKAGDDVQGVLHERLCFTLDNEKSCTSADKIPVNKLAVKKYKEQGMGKPDGDFYTVDDTRSLADKTSPGTKNINSDDEEGCKLHVIQVWKSGDTPAVANTDIVSLFARCIPTIEMSKAVPYIDIRIKLPVQAYTHETKPLSLGRFLVGGTFSHKHRREIYDANEESTQAHLEDAGELYDDYKDPIGTVGGMEIFCSPQTMVGHRNSQHTDPFRPFLSLQSIQISETPAGGLMSFKNGSLSMILHDRTRMTDVIPLIAPRSGKNARLEITWGWSHPDGGMITRPTDAGESNRFGKLINAMRITETYQVVQTTQNFTENGEVNLDVQISLLGTDTAARTEITNGEVTTAEKGVNELIKSVSEYAQDLRKQRSKIGKIDIPKVISAAGNMGSAAAWHRRNSRGLKKILKGLKGRKATKEVAGDLEKLFKQLTLLEKSKEKVYTDMITTIKYTPDPYLRPGIGNFDSSKKRPHYKKREEVVSTTGKKGEPGVKKNKKFTSQTYVSFGKLFTTFVGEALSANEEFEECQVIFYPFNESAAGCYHANIAQFPILISDLQSIITNQIKVTSQMTVGSFLSMINAFFFRDQGQVAYGLNSLFRGRDKKDKSKRARAWKKTSNEAHAHHKMALLRNIYGLAEGEPGIQFTIPQITLRFESGPRKMADGKMNGDVLRIHVMDQACGTGAQLQELIMGFSDSGVMPELTRPEPDDARSPGHGDQIAEQLKALGKDGLDVIEKKEIGDHKKYYRIKVEKLNLGSDDSENEALSEGFNFVYFANKPMSLKDLFKTIFPVIEYGVAGSNVIDAGLSTQADSALASIMMMKSAQSDADDDVGTETGLPVQIMPTQLSITMMGCPFVAFGQQYFVDFGTNTTADNFYAVTGIQHQIEAGNFKTTISLTNMMGFAAFRSVKDQYGKAMIQLEILQEKEKAAE